MPVVPDVPVGHFHLVVFGGKQGYLANTRNLCAGAPKIKVDFEGQNLAKASQKVKVKTACGKRTKKTKRMKHRR